MVTDINISTYLVAITNDAKRNLEKETKNKNKIVSKRKNLLNRIRKYSDFLKKVYNIDVSPQGDIVMKKFSKDFPLYVKVNSILSWEIDEKARVIFKNILSYFNTTKELEKSLEKIEMYKKVSKLKLSELYKVLYDYYSEVQKCLLKGDGYKIPNIGTLFIKKSKMKDDFAKRIKNIDFAKNVGKMILDDDSTEKDILNSHLLSKLKSVYKNNNTFYNLSIITNSGKYSDIFVTKYRSNGGKYLNDKLIDLLKNYPVMVINFSKYGNRKYLQHRPYYSED